MGFFDKLKSAVGQITGTNGNVMMQISSNQTKRGETINFTLQVNATGHLQAKGVHVELVGTEYVKYQYQETITGSTASRAAEGSKYNETFRNQVTVSSAPFDMQEGQSQNLSGSIQIPPSVQPTYMGVDARHTWKVRAFVDVSMGADPDTEIEILVT